MAEAVLPERRPVPSHPAFRLPSADSVREWGRFPAASVLWRCFESRRHGWSLDRAGRPLRRLLVFRRRAWVRFRNGHRIGVFRQRCAGIVGNAVCGNRWLGLRHWRTLHGTCGLRHRRGSWRIVLGRRNDVGRLRQLLIVDRWFVVGLCRRHRCREGSGHLFLRGEACDVSALYVAAKRNSFLQPGLPRTSPSGGEGKSPKIVMAKASRGIDSLPMSCQRFRSQVVARLKSGRPGVPVLAPFTRRSLPAPPRASRRASACRADISRSAGCRAGAPRLRPQRIPTHRSRRGRSTSAR